MGADCRVTVGRLATPWVRRRWTDAAQAVDRTQTAATQPVSAGFQGGRGMHDHARGHVRPCRWRHHIRAWRHIHTHTHTHTRHTQCSTHHAHYIRIVHRQATKHSMSLHALISHASQHRTQKHKQAVTLRPFVRQALSHLLLPRLLRTRGQLIAIGTEDLSQGCAVTSGPAERPRYCDSR